MSRNRISMAALRTPWQTLRESFENGNEEVMRNQLVLLQEVNEYDENGFTAVHYAVKFNRLSMIEPLCQRKANLSIKTRELPYESSLHLAARRDHEEMIKLLIEKGALKELQDADHNTPLQTATLACKTKAIEALIENGCIKTFCYLCQALKGKDENEITRLNTLIQNNEVNDFDESGLTALHWAVKLNHLSTIKLLHKVHSKDAELNIKMDLPPKSAPLHFAAKFNAESIIEFLIDNGANIEAKDEDSNTPFLTAVAHGQRKAMKTLISKGCATDVRGSDDRTAVFIAAEQDHAELLVDLLEQLQELLNSPCQSSGNTPLHIACANGNIECVKVLLDNKAKFVITNNEKRTPFHLAAMNGHVHVVEEILRYGRSSGYSPIEDEDKSARTPLHLACSKGHYNVARVLLKAKADPNAKDMDDWTPLDMAVTDGHEKIVQLLIDCAAKFDYKDEFNWTPMMTACAGKNAKVVKTLIQNGASVSVIDRDTNRNALDLAVDNGNEDIAMVIIKSDQIKDALRNTTKDDDGNETNPMRKLIIKMPDLAGMVFRCFMCLENVKNEDGNLVQKEAFDYEFLDDFDRDGEACAPRCAPNFHKRSNHCLQLLVDHSEKSRKLLKHPVVTSLVDYKWRKYVVWMNLIYFVFTHLIFIVFLTAFALTARPLGTTTACIEAEDGNSSSVNCTSDALESCSLFVPIAGGIVIIWSIIELIIEIIQMIFFRWEYFKDWFNYLEIILFISSSVFVFVFTTKNFCPTPWQWQIGALSLFLGWIGLVKHVKKLPFFGVYPFMFLNISVDFLKTAVLAALLILSFAFSFYMLFHDPNPLVDGIRIHTPFDNLWRTIVKTMTMTTGEFEFDRIFQQDNSEDSIKYPIASYLLWIIFIVVMPILLLNLLVGLAVEAYTNGIQDAELQNLVLKVNLIISAEMFLPRPLHRKWSKPNRIISHTKFNDYSLNLKIRRKEYEQFEDAYKVDLLKKTSSEELSDKVDEMETTLGSLMKTIESMSITLNELKGSNKHKHKKDSANVALCD